MMDNYPTGLQKEMFDQLRDKRLFDQAQAYAYDYLDKVLDRNVFPTEEAIGALWVFDEPLPEAPGDPGRLLQLLHEYGSPATAAQGGGRYFGFVNGGAAPAALAVRWLADVWDQNAAMYLMSPVASRLESVCEKWIVDLLGLPASTAAGVVGGTSLATLCGLAAGRNELLRRLGWDIQTQGLFGAPNLRVILGEQAHASVFKALGLLGFGRSQVELVPADGQGRMICSRMPTLDGRCLVVVQAGHVSTGAFDPIGEIAALAREGGAWVHVDGAFGLWAAASKNRRHLAAGLDQADSWSVDAHKTLNAPYDCGLVLCRDRETLRAALRIAASYLPGDENRDGMQYTPEMSRRARAVELWATLKSLGKSGVQDLVDRLCRHAGNLAAGLRANGFNVLNEVVFNQVLAAGDGPDQTRAILDYIQKSGECWCGGTIWKGAPAIRISVCSWATTEADVERTLSTFVKARERAEARPKNR